MRWPFRRFVIQNVSLEIRRRSNSTLQARENKCWIWTLDGVFIFWQPFEELRFEFHCWIHSRFWVRWAYLENKMVLEKKERWPGTWQLYSMAQAIHFLKLFCLIITARQQFGGYLESNRFCQIPVRIELTSQK